MVDGNDNTIDDTSGTRNSGMGIFSAYHRALKYSESVLNRAPEVGDFNLLTQETDSLTDIFALLRYDTLLNEGLYDKDNKLAPEFYRDDRNAHQVIADIKLLLGRATRDFATLRNNNTTDSTTIAELKDSLQEDIGRIQKLFETLSQSAQFKGSEKQDVRTLPTEGLRRSSIGAGVLATDMRRVYSRLSEASKLINKVSRPARNSPRSR